MRTAIITGAAQGIGRRTAEVLGAAGYSLLLLDRQPCDEVLSSLRAAGISAEELIGDVTDAACIAAAVTWAADHWARIDVLVNNAGVSSIAPAENVETDAFRRVLEVNLVAPFQLSKAVGSLMLRQRAGSIVNVASIAGLVGVSDRAAYNASKHGLIGLTRTLAAEWGGRGVRVNAVCPGWVKTEMDEADQAGGGYTDDDITARIPMARFASADEIARAILFLAEPTQSAFVNGHALVVDGGWSVDGSWDSLRMRKRL